MISLHSDPIDTARPRVRTTWFSTRNGYVSDEEMTMTDLTVGEAIRWYESQLEILSK